jgi:hypothetical protein
MMLAGIKHPYVWLCCSFAALGACLYGYEGVYFTGVSTLGMFDALLYPSLDLID